MTHFSKVSLWCRFAFSLFVIGLSVSTVWVFHQWATWVENIILSYLTHTGVCDIPLSYDLSDVTIVLNILVSGGVKIPVQKPGARNLDQWQQMKSFVVIRTDTDILVLFNYKNDMPLMVKKGLPDFLVNYFLDAVICPTEKHFGRWTEQSWNDMRMIWKNRIF